MMPRMDGFELLKRLGSSGNMPPAIVLTAFGNIETAIATIHDLGAFWFLEKPIQPAAFAFCWSARPRRAGWRKKPSVCSASCSTKVCS